MDQGQGKSQENLKGQKYAIDQSIGMLIEEVRPDES